MTPSVMSARAAPPAIRQASAASPMRRFITPSVSLGPRRPRLMHPDSYAQILVKLVQIGIELSVGELLHYPAVLENVIAVGDRRGEAEVLLDQHDGEALVLEGTDGLADLLDDDRGEPLG